MKGKRLFFISMTFLSGLFLSICTNDNVSNALKKVSQNIFDLISPNNGDKALATPPCQQRLYLDYIQHYFSPWTGISAYKTLQQMLEYEQSSIRTFSLDPGWGENMQPHTEEWINDLTTKMQMSAFPNFIHKAITIRDASLRVLPTNDPSFEDLNKAGQGYPFDNLQISNVKINTPVLILHQTLDKLWALVLLPDAIGWLPKSVVANVDDKFVRQWQASQFLTVLQENVIFTNIYQKQVSVAQIGSIYPLLYCMNNFCYILMASADNQDNAILNIGIIPASKTTTMPFSLTENHIALLANAMLGEPYGWGGNNGYRDCSSTMQDLFTPFGIWLPRNSADQQMQGSLIDLMGLSSKEKLKKIFLYGIPFLTLIHLPGHIMLYIGERANVPYVFQTVWGLHTRNIFFQEQRAVIGKTLIAPINLGEHFINVPSTWLDSADSMTILARDKNFTDK